MPVIWHALIAGVKFGDQPTLEKCFAQFEECILRREHVRITQPPDESAILDS